MNYRRSYMCLRACSYEPGNRAGPLAEIPAHSSFPIKNPLRSYGQTGWPACRDPGRRCRHLGKRAGNFPI